MSCWTTTYCTREAGLSAAISGLILLSRTNMMPVYPGPRCQGSCRLLDFLRTIQPRMTCTCIPARKASARFGSSRFKSWKTQHSSESLRIGSLQTLFPALTKEGKIAGEFPGSTSGTEWTPKAASRGLHFLLYRLRLHRDKDSLQTCSPSNTCHCKTPE